MASLSQYCTPRSFRCIYVAVAVVLITLLTFSQLGRKFTTWTVQLPAVLHGGGVSHDTKPAFLFPTYPAADNRTSTTKIFPPPQPKDYADRLVAFETEAARLHPEDDYDFSSFNYTVVIPTFRGHFARALSFIRSLKCLCIDLDDLDVRVILSDGTEVREFQRLLDAVIPCGSTYGIYNVTTKGTGVNIRLVNLYDILPESIQRNYESDDLGPLAEKYGKFHFQSMKKLLALDKYDYDGALIIDSEALAVQPSKCVESSRSKPLSPLSGDRERD